ncbi:MAG: pimeloyl-ACP methyl ester carboxylesterase [Candidatus Nanohaloarchaea archaeon]|jgi:pimeloyl-ACP methyl ester carboxylesterase
MAEKFIEVEDGEKVSVAHHKADSEEWIFFCHGYGTDKEGSYEKRAERAAEEGFNAVRFTFRGNGDSDGDFIDQNLSSRLRDLKSVIDYYQPEKIILFGMSFGGKVVLHALEDLEVESVVFKSPVLYNSEMDKFKEVVEEKGKYTHFDDKTIDKRFFEDFDNYSFQEAIESIDMPVALFHGGDDSTVKFKNTADAVKHMDAEIMLRKFKGETHFMTAEAEEKLLDEMMTWLKNQN